MWLQQQYEFSIKVLLVLLNFWKVADFVEYSESNGESKCGHDGGWITKPEDRIAEAGPCMLDIRDASLTQDEFLQRYAYDKPVILRRVTDNNNFFDMCQKENLLEKYGDKIIKLSSANTYSYQKFDVPFQKYVNELIKPQTLEGLANETWYWFGDNNHEEWEELFSAYRPPPYKLPRLTGAYSFGVAGAGTGVPFHFHGPVFAEVAFGRKRWFIYPPDKSPVFHPNITSLYWVVNELPKLHPDDRPMECTIGQGEVIYFPDRWWHGTLNIDTTVFISTFLG